MRERASYMTKMIEFNEKEESTPFLDESDPVCLRCREKSQRWQRLLSVVIVSNILIMFAFALVLRIPEKLQCLVQHQTDTTFDSPLEATLSYKDENRYEAGWQKELYWDQPSPESEHAWDILTKHPRGVFFTRSQSRKFGFEELPGSAGVYDGNFPIMLGVFHNIHCLRTIRASYYEDYFYENSTEEERLERREHNLHCLESLRSSIVCSPDINAYPFLWKDDEPNTELILNSAVNRKCVDLEALKVEAGKIPVPKGAP